jgi:hypothetical protein
MVQVHSREEALEWAARCPAGEHDTIEVRQVQEFSDFPSDVQAVVESVPDVLAGSNERPNA